VAGLVGLKPGAEPLVLTGACAGERRAGIAVHVRHGRRVPAAAGGFAGGLGGVLGGPDQIFATVTQYAFLAAVATVGTTATIGAAVLQRQRP
jgi:hypothetical protein